VSYDRHLIIEIDGGQHNQDQIMEKDKNRSEWLENQGFRVLRFWNNEVLGNLDGVITKIQEVLGTDKQ
jgi:very-short-patch-repair endonuclease